MQIEAVDLFYFAMPEIRDIGDGSQDLLLVRIAAGGCVGYGECEASPLPTIASFVTPMSHSACKPVRDSVLGQRLDSVADIRRIGDLVRANSLDLLQADHTLSGIDIAMWDLLARREGVPIHVLAGIERVFPKQPYASQLFGDTAEETFDRARVTANDGYTAAKFGWGPFGLGSVAADVAHIEAAREGMGPDATLLIDAGTVWRDDVARARAVLPALQRETVHWLEEPFQSDAFDAWHFLARETGSVALAGGEGCHNAWQARHMIDFADVRFIQIDPGRIGGITPALEVAAYARDRGVTYVNHTFTSHLALAAALIPFTGHAEATLCEYPVAQSPLSRSVTVEYLERDQRGLIHLPERPGLGMTINVEGLRPYLVDTEIIVNGDVLYRTPHW